MVNVFFHLFNFAEITDICPIQGQVFQQCAPPYDLTCDDDPNTPTQPICTARCACPPDAPLVDTKNNRCVKRYMCPRSKNYNLSFIINK